MTGLDVQGVRRAGEAALDWAAGQRKHFALGEDALAAAGQVDTSWKPLGELAQVCATVCQVTDGADPLHARARDLLAYAWEQTGQGELFLDLLRLEPFAPYPLEVYATLASAGLRHPGYEAAAAVTTRTRSWRLTEQQPTRRLGLLCAERHGGLPGRDRVDEALRRTWLGGLPEPWTFESASGYALTHVVFHLTDWGRADHGLPDDLAAYLAHWLPAWLDTCLEARMWDLGSELLAVAATVPGAAGALREFWPPLAAAQRPTGAIPQTGGDDTEPGFFGCYHSTVMTAFAAALTLRRGAPR